tara:strand:+ start:25611 stop:26534 length:924 start_codon:yes stop_codon:yes gene_type:complete
MPNGKNNGKIPETITIGGQEYKIKDHPELQSLVEKARKSEKNKLYSEIKGFESKIAVLENKEKENGELTAKQEKDLAKLKADLDSANAEKAELEKTIAKGGKSGGDGKSGEGKGDEPKGLTEAKVAELLEKALEKKEAAHQKEIEELRNGLNTKTVGDYRKEQLKKYEGVIIPDLVPESLDSQSDVDKAIEAAITKSKPYIRNTYEINGEEKEMSIADYEKYKAENPDGNEGGNGGSGNEGGSGGGTPDYEGGQGKPATPPSGGGGDVSGKELLSRVKDMSPEEYAKHREAILKESAQVSYGGATEE